MGIANESMVEIGGDSLTGDNARAASRLGVIPLRAGIRSKARWAFSPRGSGFWTFWIRAGSAFACLVRIIKERGDSGGEALLLTPTTRASKQPACVRSAFFGWAAC